MTAARVPCIDFLSVIGTVQREIAWKGYLRRRITVTLSIFNFSTCFLAQIEENRGGRLSKPFLGPGDIFFEKL